MKVKLLVTIDTEPDCDTDWCRSNPLSFTSVTSGIPELLRPIWDRWNISPIYFVSPEVVMNDDCIGVLKSEMDKGAIIGTHLHSEFIEPDCMITEPAGKKSDSFPCYSHETELEFQKIKNFTALIENRLGCRPIWYRAARYGADHDTIKILAELGYRFDSSVTPGISWRALGGPDHSTAQVQPYWIGSRGMYEPVSEHESLGIMEYPITIMGKRFGLLGRLLPDNWLFFRWLRPTHMTVIEQKCMIREMICKDDDPVFVMMFHSMEIMINRTPFVRNRLMQRRFLGNLERIISFMADPVQ